MSVLYINGLIIYGKKYISFMEFIFLKQWLFLVFPLIFEFQPNKIITINCSKQFNLLSLKKISTKLEIDVYSRAKI